MPPTPAARASAATSADRGSRPAHRAEASDIEGDSQQRVAGEDRGRLVEGLVDGRPPAADIVVIHRRQVVVDEAVGMDAFERRRGRDHSAALGAEQPGRLDQQERPEALAAAEHGIAHRRDEASRPGALARPPAIADSRRSSAASVARAAASPALPGTMSPTARVAWGQNRPPVKRPRLRGTPRTAIGWGMSPAASAKPHAGRRRRQGRAEEEGPARRQRAGRGSRRLARWALIVARGAGPHPRRTGAGLHGPCRRSRR